MGLCCQEMILEVEMVQEDARAAVRFLRRMAQARQRGLDHFLDAFPVRNGASIPSVL